MIYEYECEGCGHECVFEQKISDKPKKKCPECGKMKLKRLISRSSFRLVGGGWFRDGY
jgi:putative FmdB family regulatory protein